MEDICEGRMTDKFALALAADIAAALLCDIPMAFIPCYCIAADDVYNFAGTLTFKRFSKARRTSLRFSEFDPRCLANLHAKSITSSIISSARTDKYRSTLSSRVSFLVSVPVMALIYTGLSMLAEPSIAD